MEAAPAVLRRGATLEFEPLEFLGSSEVDESWIPGGNCSGRLSDDKTGLNKDGGAAQTY
jgi:hypothetical protein